MVNDERPAKRPRRRKQTATPIVLELAWEAILGRGMVRGKYRTCPKPPREHSDAAWVSETTPPLASVARDAEPKWSPWR